MLFVRGTSLALKQIEDSNRETIVSASWARLNNLPPFQAGIILLLTDGNVMSRKTDTPNWWKHIPDQYGDYVNGTRAEFAKGPNVSWD